METANPVIMWFRHNLRLTDNAALRAALRTKQPIIFVFIYDPEKTRSYGSASRWWLQNSLLSLANDIKRRGGRLHLFYGNTIETIEGICQETQADKIFSIQQFEPYEVDIENRLNEYCAKKYIELNLHSEYLLSEPKLAMNKAGQPYRVFTPFWRDRLGKIHLDKTRTAPRHLAGWSGQFSSSVQLKSLSLVSSKAKWADAFSQYWAPGEAGAQKAFKTFIKNALVGYKIKRDFPAESQTSRLSPYLHFGEISVSQVFNALKESLNQEDSACFLSEIGWREFSHHLLTHWPSMDKQALNTKFDPFPWKDDANHLKRWQQGQTGIPIVDAGMRELWETGWMHNRIRMVAASFLVKNLMIDWRWGEQWFWDTLVDANLANNTAGWQWVAGCGADAAPYFRIFNPVTQSQKFDPECHYLRKWVPEIAALPNKYIHAPWMAPQTILSEAGVELGRHYPFPIVDLKITRERALAAYKALP